MGLLLPRRPEHEDVTKIPTPSLQAAAIFINFFFPAISLLVVSLRAYSRIKTRQWGLDDYLILIALLCAVLMAGPFYLYVKLAYFGWRAKDVPEFDPSPGLWWFYVAQILYNPVLALVKASVLVFLLRLGSHKRSIRYSIYALNTFNGLQAISVFLVAVLQCLPISANWDPVVKASATCVDNSFHITISSLTLLTDILVLVIPFWIVIGLKMPKMVKAAVMVVFLLGIAVFIIGVVRLSNVIKLFYGKPDPDADPYHDIGVMLNVVEVNVAIVSASAPALRPLFRSWMPSFFAGSSGRYLSGKKAQYPEYVNSHFSNAGRHTSIAAGGSMALKSMGRTTHKSQHTECRSVSPSGSEEEIMTYNGILRTTQVQLDYQDNREHRPSGSKPSRDDIGVVY